MPRPSSNLVSRFADLLLAGEMFWTVFLVIAGCTLVLATPTPSEDLEAPILTCKEASLLPRPSNGSCPAGYGLGSCPEDLEACGPCPPDTFGDGQGTACRTCSPCPTEAQMVRPCAGFLDSECRCPRSHYWDQRKCKPCDLCPHGWGVSRQCTSDRNTMCRRCPPGTYSGVLSGTRGCVLCSVCREDQLMLQECNRIQDTICIDKNSNRRYQLVEPRAVQEHSQDIVSHYEPEVIPVYCTVLLPIVLGLLAYFLLRWRLRRTAAKAADVCDTDSSVFRQDALLLAPPTGNNPVSPATIVCKQSNTKCHLNQLSPSKRHDLEEALNQKRLDGKDWKAIAWQLGYLEQQTWAWEQTTNPSSILLSDWAQQPGATIEALSQALFRAGRMDLVWLLQPTCHKLFPPIKGDIV